MESVEVVRKADSFEGSLETGLETGLEAGLRGTGTVHSKSAEGAVRGGGAGNGHASGGAARGGRATTRAPKPVIERAGRRMNLGRRGEELAVAFLENAGYQILRRNFTCRHGEIDVIAWQRGANTLCFIEVKSRGNENMGRPYESVGVRKQKHYRQVATIFLMREWDALGIDATTEFRFDVIEVMLGGGKPEINHIRSAFA
jgi:putative endonuclease